MKTRGSEKRKKKSPRLPHLLSTQWSDYSFYRSSITGVVQPRTFCSSLIYISNSLWNYKNENISKQNVRRNTLNAFWCIASFCSFSFYMKIAFVRQSTSFWSIRYSNKSRHRLTYQTWSKRTFSLHFILAFFINLLPVQNRSTQYTSVPIRFSLVYISSEKFREKKPTQRWCWCMKIVFKKKKCVMWYDVYRLPRKKNMENQLCSAHCVSLLCKHFFFFLCFLVVIFVSLHEVYEIVCTHDYKHNNTQTHWY